MRILSGKRISVCVSGGIAAYKAAELVRGFRKHGAAVRVVMTKNAARFVGPVTFEALTGQPVMLDLFEERADAAIRHIDWAAETDLAVIAPATANVIGKLANGIADDALTTFLLAVTAKVLVCPAMNTHMYENLAVQRNLDMLEADGRILVTPDAGELACGTVGPGRLPDPPVILEHAVRALTQKDLSGARILVTAGPTWEALDPVRYITNPSSGKMGFAVALAAARRGADVTLVTGPVHLADPIGVRTVRVTSAQEMMDAVAEAFETCDAVVKAAAVSDFAPETRAEHKVKKEDGGQALTLVRTPDILKSLGAKKGGRILVGFAAETRNLPEYAAKKLAEKNLDLIAGNLLTEEKCGFGTDTNTVTLFNRDGRSETLPNMDKVEVADAILDRVRGLLNARKAAGK